MGRPARVILLGLTALASGAVVGVLATVAGVWIACERAGMGVPIDSRLVIIAGEEVNGITTLAYDRFAVSVSVHFHYMIPNGQPSVPPFLFDSSISFRNLGRTLEESMQQDYGQTPLSVWPGGMPPVPPTPLPSRWFRGLSTAKDPGTRQWRETVYGWPFRCLRVRGRTVQDGPMSLSLLPPTWTGVPGWGIAWGEVAISTAALGSPASALVLVLIVVKGPIQRRRRKRRGLCPSCGYDLRGVAAKCPECGLSEPDAPARETRRGASG
ncbi:MAG: hypothetical protein HEQ23_15445 [Tepidisphaera sp.]